METLWFEGAVAQRPAFATRDPAFGTGEGARRYRTGASGTSVIGAAPASATPQATSRSQ